MSFPEGAASEALDIQVSEPVGDTRPPYSLSGKPFRITAVGATSGLEVSQFAKPLTLEISYDDTALSGDEHWLTLFYYDTVMETWVPLPGEVDTENNVLTTQTDHFTDFDIDVQSWQAGQLPNMEGFQVSSFTGAATYNLPLWVPPGPGGLQPNLALNYNSQIVDSATKKTQANWVGMGWSLDVGYIERNMNGTSEEGRDDTYNLVVNGVSSMLLEIYEDLDEDIKTTDYRMADDNFWRVRRYKPGYEGNITTAGSWIAWDQQGNRYFFGADSSARAEYPYFNGCTHDGDRPWRWGLSEIRNIHNKSLTFTHFEESHNVKRCRGYDLESSDAAMYPAEILYPNGLYRVVFERGARNDYDSALETEGSAQFFQRSFLDKVIVQQRPDTGAPWVTIRTYDFAYNENNQDIFPGLTWSAGGKMLTLTSVREFYGGVVIPAPSFPPSSTFTYDGAHLDIATNGYDGYVDFDYENLAWHEDDTTFLGNLNALRGRRLIQNHLCRDSRQGWDSMPWAGDATVECDYDNEHLEIKGGAQARHELEGAQLQPGGVYILRVRAKTDAASATLRLGFYDGDGHAYMGSHELSSDEWASFPVTVTLPYAANMNGVKLWIACSGSSEIDCEIDRYKMLLAPTRYRVATKTLFTGYTGDDGIAPPLVMEYCYTDSGTTATEAGSATEAEAGSCRAGDDTGKTSWPDLRHNVGDAPYFKNYSEFRGNGMVTIYTPDGSRTVTTFCQSDACQGRALVVKGYDANNVLVSQTETTYTPQYLSEDNYTLHDPPITLKLPHNEDGGDVGAT
ncbi:MAG: hypothetical protein GY792_31190, partial [Gammaproteobacteria bacterium]|nr:hypothetical protein [Gammaproteobacteria bacterium]